MVFQIALATYFALGWHWIPVSEVIVFEQQLPSSKFITPSHPGMSTLNISHPGKNLLTTSASNPWLLLIYKVINSNNYYYYYNRFTALWISSGTTWVSQYQKDKTNLDFTEARVSEWQWHQLGHVQICTSLQTENHTSTHHSKSPNANNSK